MEYRRLSISLLGVGEAFYWGKLPIFSVYATDFAYVGVFEEPYEFVSYLCHCFSLNILSWVAYFFRVMTKCVIVSTVLCVFTCFFSSLIMSTFIKNYNHSTHNFFLNTYLLINLCFRALPCRFCLLFTKFYSTTFFKYKGLHFFLPFFLHSSFSTTTKLNLYLFICLNHLFSIIHFLFSGLSIWRTAHIWQ